MNVKKTTPRTALASGRGKSGENQKSVHGDYINSPIEINWTLPNDQEAEMNLLRACIASPDAADKVQEVVQAEDFYSSGCEMIFQRLCKFRNNKQSFTPNLVIESLRGHLEFDRLDMFITSLGPFWTSEDWPHWAKIVRDLSIRRKIIKAGFKAITACFELVPDIDRIVETFEAEITRLKERTHKPLTEARHAA